MTAVIVANGEFPRKEYPRWLLRNADVVVCCDGAYRHLKRLGIKPSAVVGDMDSLPSFARNLPKAGPGAAPMLVKIEEQDYNDLNKAFCWLRENYPRVDDIHILGATGKSEAHALGNLSYLMYWEQEYKLSEKGIRIDMVSDYNIAFAISDSCELHVGEGRKISFFSPDPDLRIMSSGLKWPLDDISFGFWFRATLNCATSDVASLEFNHPAPVLVILD